MKQTIRITIWIVAIFILAMGLFLAWATINDYKPDSKKTLVNQESFPLPKDTLTAMIWNIGYAGLSADMDFFYDGGSKTRTSKKNTDKNIQFILSFLENQVGVDFFMLQEVDYRAKRSYNTNEVKLIKESLNDYEWNFALNYNVKYIPSPISDPLGHVEAGLMTGSRFKPARVERHKFIGQYDWPKSLFMLDRCFLSSHFLTSTGDTLIMVNTHNTAYDDGGIRKQQMHQLKKWMMKEHNKGNHVLVGGDWNQIPPDLEVDQFGFQPKSINYSPKKVPDDFLPIGWKWAYDPNSPTNRGLDTVYHASSYQTVIDYFVGSPGVEILDIQTINLDFQYSDHNPVIVRFCIPHVEEIKDIGQEKIDGR